MAHFIPVIGDLELFQLQCTAEPMAEGSVDLARFSKWMYEKITTVPGVRENGVGVRIFLRLCAAGLFVAPIGLRYASLGCGLTERKAEDQSVQIIWRSSSTGPWG